MGWDSLILKTRFYDDANAQKCLSGDFGGSPIAKNSFLSTLGNGEGVGDSVLVGRCPIAAIGHLPTSRVSNDDLLPKRN